MMPLQHVMRAEQSLVSSLAATIVEFVDGFSATLVLSSGDRHLTMVIHPLLEYARLVI